MLKNKYLWLILLVSILPLIDLLHTGLPVTHDGQDHVARIANFYAGLQDDIWIPRWAANLNWGYGHPVLMFLYPLPSYAASLFHFVGFSFVDSVKLVFAASFVLSGLTMFLWARNMWNAESALLASVLYLFAPYRFVDLYVRGAIGEHVAFIFPPLVFYFIYKLSRQASNFNVIGGSLALAGFILAHNAISIMFLPLIFLYFLYELKNTHAKRGYITNFIVIFLMGFCLSAFFWLPAYFEGKYTLRDIVTRGEYASRFVEPKTLLWGVWNYGGTGQFTVQIGLAHWLMILGGIRLLFYKKINRLFIFGILGVFFATLFLMTDYSKFIWQIVTTLQKFQFPWRLLSITTFTSACMGGVILSSIPSKYKNSALLVIGLIAIIPTFSYWHAKSYMQKPQQYYERVYEGTTDTGESAPIWSVRFMEKSPPAPIEIIEGNGKIQKQERTSVYHSYTVNTSNVARIKENTLFFPGWHVYVNGKDTSVEFQDQRYRGLMTFNINSGVSKVEVLFKETKLRMLSDIISIISLVILAAYCILKPHIWRLFRLS